MCNVLHCVGICVLSNDAGAIHFYSTTCLCHDDGNKMRSSSISEKRRLDTSELIIYMCTCAYAAVSRLVTLTAPTSRTHRLGYSRLPCHHYLGVTLLSFMGTRLPVFLGHFSLAVHALPVTCSSGRFFTCMLVSKSVITFVGHSDPHWCGQGVNRYCPSLLATTQGVDDTRIDRHRHCHCNSFSLLGMRRQLHRCCARGCHYFTQLALSSRAECRT